MQGTVHQREGLFMMLVECLWSLKVSTNVLCIIPEPKQSLTSLIILPICFLWKWDARAIWWNHNSTELPYGTVSWVRRKRDKEEWSDIQPSMETHTQNSCSAFYPSKCTHTQQWTHTQWTHTRSSGQPFMLRRPRNSWGSVPCSYSMPLHLIQNVFGTLNKSC